MKMSKIIGPTVAVLITGSFAVAQNKCENLFSVKGMVVSHQTVELIAQISRGSKNSNLLQQNLISVQATDAIKKASDSSKSMQPLSLKTLTAEQKLMQHLQVLNPDAVALITKIKRELGLNKNPKSAGLSLDRTMVLLEVLLLEPTQSEAENQALLKMQREMTDFFNDTMDLANKSQKAVAEQQVAEFIEKTRTSSNLKELNLMVSKLFQLNVSSEKIMEQLLITFAEIKKTESSDSSLYSGLKNLIVVKFSDVRSLSVDFQTRFYEQFKNDTETIMLASLYSRSKWIDPINEIFKERMMELNDQYFCLDAAAYFLKFNLYKSEVFQTLTFIKNSKDFYSESRELADYLLKQIK